MKKLIKVNNNEINFPLSLNYESIYSSLKILLGPKASLFAEISPMTSYTTWYASDDADYQRLSDVSESQAAEILPYLNTELNQVRNELRKSPQFAPYVDDILRIPDNSYIFYRKEGLGYKFTLAGWGCRLAHSSSKKDFVFSRKANTIQPDRDDAQEDNFDDWLSDVVNLRPEDVIRKNDVQVKPESPEVGIEESSRNPENGSEGLYEKKQTLSEKGGQRSSYTQGHQKTQQVSVRVLDQNGNPVAGESVFIKSSDENGMRYTDENGMAIVGALSVSDIFSVSFPNQNGNERHFEVEANVSIYDAFIKKLVKYAPVLFVEDQNGNPVKDYDIKIIAAGQEIQIYTGDNGVVQLPMMQEGQTFIAVDMANYANTSEFEVTPEKAKSPYHFVIRRKNKKVVGISIVDKEGNPMSDVNIELADSKVPSSQLTDSSGRAEFPYEMFQSGKNSLLLKADGMNPIKHILKFNPSETEYGIIIKDKKFDWKKMGLLGLLPILGLLGWGASELINPIPSWEDLSRGVVLIKSEDIYTVDTGLSENTGFSTLYFNYSANSRQIYSATFSPANAHWEVGFGTGFFIAEDGMIATNRHVASPIPPEKEGTALLKQFFLEQHQDYQDRAEEFQKEINKYSYLRVSKNPEILQLLDQMQDSLTIYKQIADIYDSMLKLSDFKVNVICKTSAAFCNSMITSINDQVFHPCTCLAYGEPGDVNTNDVAIIQLNEKDKIMPKDAYIFKIPKSDPLTDKEVQNSDYEVCVLGYSDGLSDILANPEVGIKPQKYYGHIGSVNNEYHIQYSGANLAGSSGSPVLNKKRQLVAVNNASLGDTNIKFGVRTKYLYELFQQVKDKRNESNK